MLLSVFLGNSMQVDLRSIPLDTIIQQRDSTSLKFLVFAFGFPAGLGLSLLGALIGSEPGSGRIWIFLFVSLSAASAAFLVPLVFGRDLSPLFFGNAGYIMMLLILASVWYWGRYRARLPQSGRLSVDLQGMGYFCFAVAAWNICGAATMPSFALEPKTMLAMESQAFAIGLMKAIMILFLFGWIFTLLGWRLAVKQHNKESGTA
jgi:hypothetical protein